MPDDPDLPFAPDKNLPRISLEMDGSPILATGVVVVTTDQLFGVKISDLTYLFRFVDEGDSPPQWRGEETSDPKRVQLILKNFKNPLGSGFGPIQAGTLAGQQFYLTAHIHALGEKNRVLTYTFYVGKKNA
jgi:hypothetical protein